jgi:hypothetical protein
VEKINERFLFKLKGTPAEYKAGLERAIANGRLALHESGTFVKFTEAAQRCSPDEPKRLGSRLSRCRCPLDWQSI